MSAGGTKGRVKNAKRMVLVRVDSGQQACQKHKTLGQRLPVLMDLQSNRHVKRMMGMMEGGQAAAGTHSLLHKIAEGEQFTAHHQIVVAHHNLQKGHSVQEEVSFSGMRGRRLHLECVICRHLEAFLILFLPLHLVQLYEIFEQQACVGIMGPC